MGHLDSVKKILCIDDEYVLRQSIVAYLEDSGFIVAEAENGEQGLELVRQELPDLILTDLQMPIMNGFELLEVLRKQYAEIPVVVISGAGGLNEVIKALRLGAWDYLTKPISDLEVLEHAVYRSLEKSKLIKENIEYAARLARNLHTLEEDQEAGRSVQKRLLPSKKMQVNDYVFEHNIIPSLYLSGDFVDYFKVNDDYYVMYLADVSGHGASSAFVTVLLKSLISQSLTRFQSQGDKTILSPNKILQELSHEIYTAKLGKYITMVYCVLNVNTNKCEYVVAGHYPSPVFIDGQQIQYLAGSGFPVGILPKVEYEVCELTISAHAKLVIFSDGIMEMLVAAQDMQEKEKILLDILLQHDAKIDDVLQNCGVDTQNQNHEYPDDITILVINRKDNKA